MISAAALQGHWRRTWLRAPKADPVREDATTRVHWIQAGPWCADIRVPRDRQGLGARARCLADLAPGDLADLLAAEGFAGRVTLADDVCTWARHWNWRGFPCPVDAGALAFDTDGRLIEDGVHADYREEWERMPGPQWVAYAVRGDAGEGMMLSCDTDFLLALGRRDGAAWPYLPDALRAGQAATGDAAPVFASTYILGRWDGARGIAALSTQPFCEGLAVLARGGPLTALTMCLTLPDFHGSTTTQTLRLSPLPAA